MFRTCIFCASDLGSNEVIEAFPIGRRLAFDESTGRLWVICKRCSRWNLSPLEERWEAIEQCERIFRETRTRVSTEHIGLARVKEGLDLVRIGKALRPEFAAWRYGQQFGTRMRRAYTAMALTSGLSMAGSLVYFVGLPAHILSVAATGAIGTQLLVAANDFRRSRFLIYLDNGKRHKVKNLEAGATMIRAKSFGLGWEVIIPISGQTLVLEGPEALRALQSVMPRINAYGASKGVVSTAVSELECVGNPNAYFRIANQRAKRTGLEEGFIGRYPEEVRLAVEMAANEESERRAMEEELTALENAWRQAEEIAQIADQLTLSQRVSTAFNKLKRGNDGGSA